MKLYYNAFMLSLFGVVIKKYLEFRGVMQICLVKIKRQGQFFTLVI